MFYISQLRGLNHLLWFCRLYSFYCFVLLVNFMCICFLSHRPQPQIASSLKEGTVDYSPLCPLLTSANQVHEWEVHPTAWIYTTLFLPRYPFRPFGFYISPFFWPLQTLWFPTTPSLWTCLCLSLLSIFLDGLRSSTLSLYLRPSTCPSHSILQGNLPQALSQSHIGVYSSMIF